MSGIARRKSIRKWAEDWCAFLYAENEIMFRVLNVDWIRGQITSKDYAYSDEECDNMGIDRPKVIISKIPHKSWWDSFTPLDFEYWRNQKQLFTQRIPFHNDR